jgi:hypothetical protein
MELKIIIIAIVAVIVLALLVKNTQKWSRSLQNYYVTQSNQLYGNSGGWDKPWRLKLFNALVIFFGLMAILAAYVAVFSAV